MVLRLPWPATVPSYAQVITMAELSDPKAQRLQQRHLQTLMGIATEIELTVSSSLLLQPRLDVDLPKMQSADERSIRFDT